MTLPVPRDHASDIEAARLEADQLAVRAEQQRLCAGRADVDPE